jgi:type VI secretion system secreted protein VgrG
MRSASKADYLFIAKEYPDELRVLDFNGTEGISEPFRYNLRLAALDSEIDFDTIIGKPAYLSIYGETGERYVNGIVTRFVQAGIGNRYTIYHAEIVPLVWLLSMRYKSRIFQNMSLKDIITQVFQDAGIQTDYYRFSIQGKHDTHEYCVQYRESDFNFISRLMEHEGIFYFFEHDDEKHVMIIADNSAVHVPIESPTVVFNEPSEMVPEKEHIYEYQFSQQVKPGAVMLRNFNFKMPSLDLQVDSTSETDDKQFEVYDYPGGYLDQEMGNEMATLRLEAIVANRQVGSGRSVCRRFMPGYKFQLGNYARPDFNQEYLIIRLASSGTQPLGEDQAGEGFSYSNEFECILAPVPYRPTLRTLKPKVEGSQTAIVVGPSGDDIYTDEYGRVKVQFHWDREGQMDENSSCWVRVRQLWAGPAWGGMFIPRIGQEVIVDFLEGDPDQPIIIGAVYNGDNEVPYKLPDEMTKSTIKSNSSKGGQGFNEIRFEDKKGEEQIFIHAEKDVDFRVKNDRREWIGNDQHLFVKRDKREQVERDKHVNVGRDEARQVKRDHNLTIKGKDAIEVKGSRSIVVKGNVIEEFKQNHSEQVTQDYYLKAMNVVIEAMTGLSIKVGGNFITINSGGIFIKGNMVMINSGGSTLSGKADNPVSPVAPLEAEIADTAQPGREVTYKSQRTQMEPAEIQALNAPWHKEPEEPSEERQKGPVLTPPVAAVPLRLEPEQPPEKREERPIAAEQQAEEKQETTWIEVELLDEADQPVAGERYWIRLPDGTMAQGRTDENGIASVRGIKQNGNCAICFPDLDKDAWEPIQGE